MKSAFRVCVRSAQAIGVDASALMDALMEIYAWTPLFRGDFARTDLEPRIARQRLRTAA